MDSVNILADESLEEALIREIKEETGIHRCQQE
ncbi:NUDIX hydrolase [Paenibacillus baekrokdamisoli]